jgi:pimeloyl-ACP methyl ester carboxylesterase
MDPASVVLVHGGWHGAWCWEEVAPALRQRGVEAITLDLPFTGLADDTSAVRSVLDAIDGPVVLCGHSYGGAVVTGAGEHDAVRRMIYLAAFLLDEGENMLSVAGDIDGSELPAAMRFTADGRCTVDEAAAVGVFYHDCPAETARRAAARLRSWPLDSSTSFPPAQGWKTRPTTYVVCDDDRAVPPALQQRLAERATEVHHWPTSHSPFLARPDLVIELLAREADATTG